MHKYFLVILLSFCVCGCSSALSGMKVRELRYGMTPMEVNSILNAQCYMPFLAKHNDAEYRYMIFSSNRTYPSFHIVFKNGRLSKAVLPDQEPYDDFDKLLEMESIAFEFFDPKYDLSGKIHFDELPLALAVILMNLGNIHGEDLYKVKLNSSFDEVKSLVGSPDDVMEIPGASLWIYESGCIIGCTGYAFEFKESKLTSIFEVTYLKKASLKDYEESRARYFKHDNH